MHPIKTFYGLGRPDELDTEFMTVAIDESTGSVTLVDHVLPNDTTRMTPASAIRIGNALILAGRTLKAKKAPPRAPRDDRQGKLL